MPRKGWPLAPAFGGCGLDGAWRSAEVCHQEIDGEVWPRCNFKPLVFSQFQTAVDTLRALGSGKSHGARCLGQDGRFARRGGTNGAADARRVERTCSLLVGGSKLAKNKCRRARIPLLRAATQHISEAWQD